MVHGSWEAASGCAMDRRPGGALSCRGRGRGRGWWRVLATLKEPTCLVGVHGGSGDREWPSSLPTSIALPSGQPLLIEGHS